MLRRAARVLADSRTLRKQYVATLRQAHESATLWTIVQDSSALSDRLREIARLTPDDWDVREALRETDRARATALRLIRFVRRMS